MVKISSIYKILKQSRLSSKHLYALMHLIHQKPYKEILLLSPFYKRETLTWSVVHCSQLSQGPNPDSLVPESCTLPWRGVCTHTHTHTQHFWNERSISSCLWGGKILRGRCLSDNKIFITEHLLCQHIFFFSNNKILVHFDKSYGFEE